jgi:transposase
MVARVLAGRPKAHVAAEMGVSRPTVHKWCLRFETQGVAGLEDRSSRPHRSPSRTCAELEAEIAALRR